MKNIEENDFYRWHDLTTDPTDLPTEEYKLYLCWNNETNKPETACGWWIIADPSNPACDITKRGPEIVAWAEIRPFKKGMH